MQETVMVNQIRGLGPGFLNGCQEPWSQATYHGFSYVLKVKIAKVSIYLELLLN